MTDSRAAEVKKARVISGILWLVKVPENCLSDAMTIGSLPRNSSSSTSRSFSSSRHHRALHRELAYGHSPACPISLYATARMPLEVSLKCPGYIVDEKCTHLQSVQKSDAHEAFPKKLLTADKSIIFNRPSSPSSATRYGMRGRSGQLA